MLFSTSLRGIITRLIEPFETGKLEFFSKWLQNRTFRTNVNNINRFTITPSYLTTLCKKNGNSEYVQAVNTEFTDWSKNNCTKCLLIFDNPGEKIGKSKAFVDSAKARTHR